MGALYVTEQGAVLRRTGERLIVTRGDEVLDDVPLIHVDQVVIMGNVQITTPAMALLLSKEVDVVFMSSYGKYRGRLMTTGSRFAELRRRQLYLLADERQILELARALVVAKLSGQAALLKRWSADGQALGGVRRAIRQAEGAGAIDVLRGHEGSGGAAYFAGLRALLPAEWGFERRIYHPPTDRVNALLSLGYTLLLKDVTAAVQLVGLDPYMGAFHTLEQGRPSLCLDLMEPFRPLVDDLVLRLVTEGSIAYAEFEGRRDGAMLLAPPARNRYLKAYEARLARRVPVSGEEAPAPGEQTTTQRRCLELNARRWARAVLGQEQHFTSFVVQE